MFTVAGEPLFTVELLSPISLSNAGGRMDEIMLSKLHSMKVPRAKFGIIV